MLQRSDHLLSWTLDRVMMLLRSIHSSCDAFFFENWGWASIGVSELFAELALLHPQRRWAAAEMSMVLP